MRLLLGGGKKSRFLHPPARILTVVTESLAGFSHLFSPDLKTLLFQGDVSETAPSVGVVDRASS